MDRIMRPFKKPIPIVKSFFGLPAATRRKVLLANHPTVITRIGQNTGEHLAMIRQRNPIGPKPMIARIHASEQRRPRWAANRVLNVALLKNGPLRGEPVKVRGFRMQVSVTPKRIKSLLVCAKHQDVRLRYVAHAVWPLRI